MSYDRDEHRQKVRDYFIKENPTLDERQLSNALYAMGELYLFEDEIDSMSVAQALQIWRVVETIRQLGFPRELGM